MAEEELPPLTSLSDNTISEDLEALARKCPNSNDFNLNGNKVKAHRLVDILQKSFKKKRLNLSSNPKISQS